MISSSDDDIENQKSPEKRQIVSKWGNISADSDDDSAGGSQKISTPVVSPKAKRSSKMDIVGMATNVVSPVPSITTPRKSAPSSMPFLSNDSAGKSLSRSKIGIEPSNRVPLFQPSSLNFFLNAVSFASLNNKPYLMVASSSCIVDAVNIRTGETVVKFQGNLDRVLCLSVSPSPPPDTPNGRQYVASGACDDTIVIWEFYPSGPRMIHIFKGHTGSVWSVQLYVDPITLHPFLFSAGNEGLIKVWNVRSGRRVNSFKGHVGRVLTLFVLERNPVSAIADNTHSNSHTSLPRMKKDLSTSSLGSKVSNSSQSTRTSRRNSVRTASDRSVNNSMTGETGNVVISGGADGTIRVWDMFSGTQRQLLKGHTSEVHCVKAFYLSAYDSTAPFDKIILISGSLDCSVRVWDMGAGAVLHALQGHNGCVYDICYYVQTQGSASMRTYTTPVVTVISADATGEVRTWDLHEGQLIKACSKKLHQEGIRGVCVKKGIFDSAPDQVILASCGWDKQLMVKNIEDVAVTDDANNRCVIS